MPNLSAIGIPAMVSIIVTILTTIVLDRCGGFIYSHRLLNKIKENSPQITYRRHKNNEPVKSTDPTMYYMYLKDIEDQEKTGLFFLEKSASELHFDESYIRIRIVNNTSHGATVTAILGTNSESLTISSGWEDIDIDPGKSISIFAYATPQPITAIEMSFCDYILTYSIERSNQGYIQPQIKKRTK